MTIDGIDHFHTQISFCQNNLEEEETSSSLQKFRDEHSLSFRTTF